MKFVFGDPEQMAGLLRATLPRALVEAVDWSTLRRVPGSFVDAALDETRTDMLFAAELGEATVFFHLLTETKSQADPFTSLQIARYVVRIHDHWRSLHPQAKHLPPILPIVIYHGTEPWTSPRSPKELVDLSGCPSPVAGLLDGLQLHQPFVLLDLSGLTEERIDAMRLSTIASLSLRFLQFLRHAPPDQASRLILRWRLLVHELLAYPHGRDVVFALFSWYAGNAPAYSTTLRTVMTKIQKENPTMRTLYDQLLEIGEDSGVRKGRRQGMREGRRKGIEKGTRQGERSMLLNLLAARFGVLPANVRTQVEAAGSDQLRAFGLRLLTAATLAEVLQSP